MHAIQCPHCGERERVEHQEATGLWSCSVCLQSWREVWSKRLRQEKADGRADGQHR